jgi:hypothetical protein
MLAPISLAKRLILLKQFVLTLLLEILNRSRHRQLGRDRDQHMHVVSIDRARVNRHFVRPRNLTQKLPRAWSNVPTQNRIAVFRHPNQVIPCNPKSCGCRACNPSSAQNTASAPSRSPRASCFCIESGTGFPNRGDFDSTCWLGGGQQGCRSHTHRTCVTV